jgi:hypothetical protein
MCGRLSRAAPLSTPRTARETAQYSHPEVTGEYLYPEVTGKYSHPKRQLLPAKDLKERLDHSSSFVIDYCKFV